MDPSIRAKMIEALRERFSSDSSGHDIDHTLRVARTAMVIQSAEGGDPDIVELAALLHDADDRKLFGSEGCPFACSIMKGLGFDGDEMDRVIAIIRQVSFKGTDSVSPDSLEGRIVQDADRLDAIGAIGIARAFAYGGSRGRRMHDPSEPPKAGMDAREYYANEGTTVNHFHEKLLLLKDMMNTDTGRRMAESRHAFMLEFLDRFEEEWESTV